VGPALRASKPAAVIIVGAGPAGSAAALRIAARRPDLAARTLVLDQEGRVERLILQAMDGTASNHQIASSLMADFPHLFPKFNDALGRVGSVARRFGTD